MLRWQDSEAPLVFFLASRSWQSGRALTFSAPLQKSVILLPGFCQKLDNNYFDKIGISRISFVRAVLVIGQLINLQSWGKCSRLFKYVFHKWLNYKICHICIDKIRMLFLINLIWFLASPEFKMLNPDCFEKVSKLKYICGRPSVIFWKIAHFIWSGKWFCCIIPNKVSCILSCLKIHFSLHHMH